MKHFVSKDFTTVFTQTESHHFVTAGQRRRGEVMFSVVSIRQSVILSRGSRVTITRDALDLTVQSPQHGNSLYRDSPQALAPQGHSHPHYPLVGVMVLKG